MELTRRGFLTSILALAAAPAIVRASSLMSLPSPKKILIPPNNYVYYAFGETGEFDAGTTNSGTSVYYLGWRPQFIFLKPILSGGDWLVTQNGEIINTPISAVVKEIEQYGHRSPPGETEGTTQTIPTYINYSPIPKESSQLLPKLLQRI